MPKKKKPKISEQQYAEVLVEWLGEQGWEVYQEVPRRFSGVCDILAVKKDERIAWMIEVKASADFKVFYQARDCLYSTPMVSVAIPKPKRTITENRLALIEKCEENGIGFIHIDYKNGTISERLVPDVTIGKEKHWCVAIPKEHLFNMCDEYKTYCKAGSASGGHFTAFKATCMNISDYVHAHPGCTLKEAIENVSHHYSSNSSAMSALSKLEKLIPDVEFRWCAFPKEDESK